MLNRSAGNLSLHGTIGHGAHVEAVGEMMTKTLNHRRTCCCASRCRGRSALGHAACASQSNVGTEHNGAWDGREIIRRFSWSARTRATIVGSRWVLPAEKLSSGRIAGRMMTLRDEW